jgi:predicted nucleotidyltransferase
MKNSPLNTLLIDMLAPYKTIVFALLFGSQCGGNIRFDSDIDIALYFEDIPDLLTLGGIIAELESVMNKKIDLIVLNDLHSKNPLLAYNIIGKYDILINRDAEAFEAFKVRSYMSYFDFEPVMVAQNKKLAEELNNGNFGKAKRA